MLQRLFATACLLAASGAMAAQPPHWLLDEIAFQTRDGGRWVASNARYRSDTERWEAYGVEWVAGPAGASMSGRLFGIADGKDSLPFWQFSQYWDPARGEVVVEQYGWSEVGIGTAWQEGEEIKMKQTFTSFDGKVRIVGHVSAAEGEDAYRTTSFSIDDGVWSVSRSYVWEHQAQDQPND